MPFSFDRFWALKGPKLACLEIKDGGSNMVAKKVMSSLSLFLVPNHQIWGPGPWTNRSDRLLRKQKRTKT